MTLCSFVLPAATAAPQEYFSVGEKHQHHTMAGMAGNTCESELRDATPCEPSMDAVPAALGTRITLRLRSTKTLHASKEPFF